MKVLIFASVFAGMLAGAAIAVQFSPDLPGAEAAFSIE